MKILRKKILGIILLSLFTLSCSEVNSQKNFGINGDWRIIGFEQTEENQDNSNMTIALAEAFQSNDFVLNISNDKIIVADKTGRSVEEIKISKVSDTKIAYHKEAKGKVIDGTMTYRKIDKDKIDLHFDSDFVYHMEKL